LTLTDTSDRLPLPWTAQKARRCARSCSYHAEATEFHARVQSGSGAPASQWRSVHRAALSSGGEAGVGPKHPGGCRRVGCGHVDGGPSRDRFLTDGVEGLYDRRRGNAAGKADERLDRVLTRLLGCTPEDFGWGRPTWTRELFCLQMKLEGGPWRCARWAGLCRASVRGSASKDRGHRARPAGAWSTPSRPGAPPRSRRACVRRRGAVPR
jgi:hypothetical protein